MVGNNKTGVATVSLATHSPLKYRRCAMSLTVTKASPLQYALTVRQYEIPEF